MITKKQAIEVAEKSASKIPDDDWCDECGWLFDMIVNGIEDIEEEKNENKK
jgi:hypothetical protein